MIDSTQVPFDEKRLMDLLQEYWGFDSFRDSQKGPIQSMAQGFDTIAVLPTGGGKSLCYQVSGLYRGGICLVISPLIALMEDQVLDLKSRGLSAISLAGMKSYRDIERLLDNAERLPSCFLYCSPERLSHPLFKARINRLQINTIAVDEAHCISQWGHDFRPEYRTLHALRMVCSGAVIGAFTATATAVVAVDVQRQLKLEAPRTFVSPMARPNLVYSVLDTGDAEAELMQALSNSNGTGLLYVSSRSDAEIWTSRMQAMGISAGAYHAGLTADERARTQTGWMNGERRVLACTSAFGMGIDKQNVRFVYHASPPQDLEGYVQEAGRAGRDGDPSACVLFVNRSAKKWSRERLEQRLPNLTLIQEVYQGLANQGQVPVGSLPVEPTTFDCHHWLRSHGINFNSWRSSIDFLQRAGYVTARRLKNERIMEVTFNGPGHESFQERHPFSYDVFSELKRTMEETDSSSCRVQLRSLASNCGISLSKARHELEKLKNWGLIGFEEIAPDYSIDWKRPREESKNVTLPRELQIDWVESLEAKWEAIQSYLTTDICRQVAIQSYFSEEPAQSCGVCDNCLKQNESWARGKWLNSIPDEGVDLKSWIKKTPVRHKSVLFHFLRKWMAANEIEVLNSILHRL